MKQRKTKGGGFKTNIALMLVAIFFFTRLCSAPEVAEEDIQDAPYVEIHELNDYLGTLVRIKGIVKKSFSVNMIGGIFTLQSEKGTVNIRTEFYTPKVGDALEVCIYVKPILQINELYGLLGIEKERKTITQEYTEWEFEFEVTEEEVHDLDFISIIDK